MKIDNSIVLNLKLPEVLNAQRRTYRYFVELIGNQLDYEGVTESSQLVEVVVFEPTKEAIASVIAAAGWLSAYSVVSYWVPEDETEF